MDYQPVENVRSHLLTMATGILGGSNLMIYYRND